MFTTLRCLVLSLCFSSVCFLAQARTIHYNNHPSAKEQYLVGMFKLALEKSDSGYQAKPLETVLTDAKALADLADGTLDVYWAPSSKVNEEKYLPIRIPLVKGLLGYRLFIINQGEEHKFSGISNLQELKQLSAGQGTFWGDTQVLAGAGIPLETSVKYEGLFYMLEGGRFDYFPRAAHEPWSEVKSHAELNLTVEKSLMLVYPLAMYLYVNKSDAELAQALETGLENAIRDGSFDDYFYGHPLIQSALNEANLKDRTVINIDNPFLPESTPLARKELWLDVASL